jgi:hypothetical protein
MPKGERLRSTLATLFLCFALAATLGACKTATPRENAAADQDELDVITSYLSQLSNFHTNSQQPFVVNGTYISVPHEGSYGEFEKSLLDQAPAHDGIPAELIHDFCAKTAAPQKIWPDLKKRLNVVLLSPREFATFTSRKVMICSIQNTQNPKFLSSPESASINGGIWR